MKPSSNAKQRNVAKEWSGNDVTVEETPFKFEVKDYKGHYEIRTAPWGYIQDLPTHILNLLDCLQK